MARYGRGQPQHVRLAAPVVTPYVPPLPPVAPGFFRTQATATARLLHRLPKSPVLAQPIAWITEPLADASTGFYAIEPSTVYTIMADFKAATSPRTCSFSVNWYTSGSVFISTDTSAGIVDTTSGWTQALTSPTSPANAAKAKLVPVITTPAGGEVHYMDKDGIFPGIVTTWSRGGLVGSTTAAVLRSDGLYVRGASPDNPLAIPAPSETATVYDPEAIPGVSYTYTAVISAVLGIGATISSSPSAPSAAADVSASNRMWLFDPMDPTTAVGFNLGANWQPGIHEVGGIYYPLGNDFAIKSTDGTKGIGGTLPVLTVSDGQDERLVALFQSNNTLMLLTPTRGGWYILWDPGTDRKGSVVYESTVPSPFNTWQSAYFQTQRPPV